MLRNWAVGALASLHDSWVKSWQSTVSGLVLSAAILLVNYTTGWLASVQGPWVPVVAMLVALIGGMLKSAQVRAGAAAAKKAALLGSLLLAVLLAAPARAQDVTPPPGPLAVQLTPDWSLHLNVAVPAFGYSITQGKFLGQLTFALTYVVDYKSLVAIGVGGGYSQTNDQPGVTFTGMVGGPVLPFKIADGTSLRPAALYEYRWAGGIHENVVAGTIALQF